MEHLEVEVHLADPRVKPEPARLPAATAPEGGAPRAGRPDGSWITTEPPLVRAPAAALRRGRGSGQPPADPCGPEPGGGAQLVAIGPDYSLAPACDSAGETSPRDTLGAFAELDVSPLKPAQPDACPTAVVGLPVEPNRGGAVKVPPSSSWADIVSSAEEDTAPAAPAVPVEAPLDRCLRLISEKGYKFIGPLRDGPAYERDRLAAQLSLMNIATEDARLLHAASLSSSPSVATTAT